MKKLMMIIALITAGVFGMSAKDSYSRNASDLPQAAQQTIKNNFKASVSVIKIDKDFGRVSEYDVTLTDGSEISFDNKGNWKDVEVGNGHSVPSAFIPSQIASYIKANQPKQKVVGIEKERGGYEVTLSNGLDLKFDKNGSFVKYD